METSVYTWHSPNSQACLNYFPALGLGLSLAHRHILVSSPNHTPIASQKTSEASPIGDTAVAEGQRRAVVSLLSLSDTCITFSLL